MFFLVRSKKFHYPSPHYLLIFVSGQRIDNNTIIERFPVIKQRLFYKNPHRFYIYNMINIIIFRNVIKLSA